MTTKPEQCCDEPRGFVGGVCDHCGGEVQSEYTNLELEQQVSDWRQKAYKLERERDAYKNALLEINELADDDRMEFALDSIQALTHNILNE